MAKSSESVSTPIDSSNDDSEGNDLNQSKLSNASFLITIWIVIASTVMFWVFKSDISEFGSQLMMRHGQDRVDLVLFLITSISCTPVVLPVWCYVPSGLLLGYGILRLATVMALGSAVGSITTFAIGRFFSNTSWAKRRFPRILKHPWTHGKSKMYVTWILLVGTASPIPCDIVYAAAGAKRYPAVPFFCLMVAGRFVRYISLGLMFRYLLDWS